MYLFKIRITLIITLIIIIIINNLRMYRPRLPRRCIVDKFKKEWGKKTGKREIKSV